MNPLVRLVNEWDSYAQRHPSADIDDFCRYYLVKGHTKKNKSDDSCPEDHSRLMKTLATLTGSFNTFYKAAMLKTSLPFSEAFYFLNVLLQNGEIKKTELITLVQMEYTTGMEGISKLLKAGLIREKADETDKRAKKISITKSGEKALFKSYAYMSKIGELMFGKMKDDSIKLCIQLLQDRADENTELVSQYKNKDFDEIYDAVVTKRAVVSK